MKHICPAWPCLRVVGSQSVVLEPAAAALRWKLLEMQILRLTLTYGIKFWGRGPAVQVVTALQLSWCPPLWSSIALEIAALHPRHARRDSAFPSGWPAPRNTSTAVGAITSPQGLSVVWGLIPNQGDLSWCHFIGTVNNNILHIHIKFIVYKAFSMVFTLILPATQDVDIITYFNRWRKWAWERLSDFLKGK